MSALLLSALIASALPEPAKSDVAYGPDVHQRLDVYLPAGGKGPFPVLIWYGGLFVPAKVRPPADRFLKAGCAVVSVEIRGLHDAFREGVRPPISRCLLDARRAVQFVRLHAADWGLDPGRIALGGSSQGALPALFVGCSPDAADPRSDDPVGRISSKVIAIGAHRSQPSIDPLRMQEWVPGVDWGAPAFGCGFAESLRRREELLPEISRWSPDALVGRDAPPIYFENNWGLERPVDAGDLDYKIHSPAWALGFQEIARSRGATCLVKYPGHPTEGYEDLWDFLERRLKTP